VGERGGVSFLLNYQKLLGFEILVSEIAENHRKPVEKGVAPYVAPSVAALAVEAVAIVVVVVDKVKVVEIDVVVDVEVGGVAVVTSQLPRLFDVVDVVVVVVVVDTD